MTKTILLATTAILLSGGSALARTDPQVAQAPVATGPTTSAPLADATQQGVLVFTPDFFAAQRPNTALDMVNRVPGFDLQDGSGSRGFEGAVGNVLINNTRPASKNDTGSNVLGRTVASQVERIELIRGGAPGIDMQGYSVVVNVILKSAASHQQILTYDGILFEGGHDVHGLKYQFTATNGDRSWGVTLADGIGTSDSNGVGRVVRRDASGTVIRDEGVYSDSYGGGQAIRGNYAGPLLGGKIDMTARIGVSDWQGLTLQDSPTTYRENRDTNDNTNGELGIVYTRALNPRWALETRLIHQFEDFDNLSTSNVRRSGVDDPEQAFSANGKSSETILRALVRNERSPAVTIETGGEIAYNMLQTDQAFTIGGTPVVLPSASVKVEETRGEIYSKGTWRIRPTLTLEAGLRIEGSTISQTGDANQEKTLYFAKPRFLATWTPMPNDQVRFRFERELGQLDFGDFAASADLGDETVRGGNVDLEPEQRWISELTYERRFWGDGVVSLGYRHDRIIDVIDRLPLDGGLSATGNIGDGTLDRLSLSFTVPTDKLHIPGGRLTFANDWNKTEVTDPTTGDKRPISGVRPSQINLGWTQDLPSWKLQYGANYLPSFDDPSFDPDQRTVARLRNYFEGFVEYKPTATLSIRAQLNIWDDFGIDRVVYADRNLRTVAFTEHRQIDPRTFWSFKVRKTF
ncbi:TonB-dependent receptor [soil metagenome]